MENQRDVESAMIQIRPRAKHFTYQADLLYMTGLARACCIDVPLDGVSTSR
jgi:hypothetical protein